MPLWEHFLGCTRSRNPETLCPADLGYAAIATVNLGVQSYREGKAYYFDKGTGESSHADTGWSARWEERSQLARQAKPSHRLEGRRYRLAAQAPRIPEARGRLGRRQGSRLRSLECSPLERKIGEPRVRESLQACGSPFLLLTCSSSVFWRQAQGQSGSHRPSTHTRRERKIPGLRPPKDDQVGRFACVEAGQRSPEQPCGIGRDRRDRLLERPVRASKADFADRLRAPGSSPPDRACPPRRSCPTGSTAHSP